MGCDYESERLWKILDIGMALFMFYIAPVLIAFMILTALVLLLTGRLP